MPNSTKCARVRNWSSPTGNENSIEQLGQQVLQLDENELVNRRRLRKRGSSGPEAIEIAAILFEILTADGRDCLRRDARWSTRKPSCVPFKTGGVAPALEYLAVPGSG
jgi:hypothetical protein